MLDTANGPSRALAKAAAFGGGLAGSAFLMALALRSSEGRWLGWVTLLPLLLAIRCLIPRWALAAGGWWGLCLALFSSAGADATLALTARSISLLTLIPALYAMLGSAVTRRVGFSPLLLGLGWAGVELALQPLALHHGLLAHTQGQGLFVRAIGHVAGYVVVAFLVAYVNASLLEMFAGVCDASGSRTLPVVTGDLVRLFSPMVARPVVRCHAAPGRPRAPPC